MLAMGFMADLVPFPNPVHLISLALACYYFCLVIRYKLAVFRKAREGPEALHNPRFDRRMGLAQIAIIATWCSFPALWFVYYFGFLSMSQIDLYPLLDVSSKLVASVLFCNVDIGRIDNSKKQHMMKVGRVGDKQRKSDDEVMIWPSWALFERFVGFDLVPWQT